MGRSRKCCIDNCDKFAKHSVDGIYLYCISHMRQKGLIPKESPKKRRGGRAMLDAGSHSDLANYELNSSHNEYDDDAVTNVGPDNTSSQLDDAPYAQKNRESVDQGEEEKEVASASDDDDLDGPKLSSTLLEVVQTLLEVKGGDVSHLKRSPSATSKSLGLRSTDKCSPSASARMGGPCNLQHQDSEDSKASTKQAFPSSLYKSSRTRRSQQVSSADELASGRQQPCRYPEVYDDDDTPIVRRGSHKGRVCAHHGCEKFARLSINGIRKYCIIHMRVHGLTPKDYGKKPQQQQHNYKKLSTPFAMDDDTQRSESEDNTNTQQQLGEEDAGTAMNRLSRAASVNKPVPKRPPPAPRPESDSNASRKEQRTEPLSPAATGAPSSVLAELGLLNWAQQQQQKSIASLLLLGAAGRESVGSGGLGSLALLQQAMLANAGSSSPPGSSSGALQQLLQQAQGFPSDLASLARAAQGSAASAPRGGLDGLQLLLQAQAAQSQARSPSAAQAQSLLPSNLLMMLGASAGLQQAGPYLGGFNSSILLNKQ